MAGGKNSSPVERKDRNEQDWEQKEYQKVKVFALWEEHETQQQHSHRNHIKQQNQNQHFPQLTFTQRRPIKSRCINFTSQRRLTKRPLSGQDWSTFITWDKQAQNIRKEQPAFGKGVEKVNINSVEVIDKEGKAKEKAVGPENKDWKKVSDFVGGCEALGDQWPKRFARESSYVD